MRVINLYGTLEQKHCPDEPTYTISNDRVCFPVVAELIYTISLRPIAEEQTDTLAVVRSPDTLGDGGADIYSNELAAAFLVVVLGYSVCDLGNVI